VSAPRPGRVLLATRNAGKVRELAVMLASLGVELVGVEALESARGAAPEVEETGRTFAANAELKARAYAAWAKLPVIAEDSGIEVDALAGRPGVHSARYSGVVGAGADAANNAKLLHDLQGVPDAQRTARYRTAAVYLAPGGEPLLAMGTWEGRIGHEPRGTGGFGYDPLFVVPELNCTAAQLGPAQKNERSHRGRAVAELLAQLASAWRV